MMPIINPNEKSGIERFGMLHFSKIVLYPHKPTNIDCWSFAIGDAHPQSDWFGINGHSYHTSLDTKNNFPTRVITVHEYIVTFDDHSKYDYQKVLSNFLLEFWIGDILIDKVPLSAFQFGRVENETFTLADILRFTNPYLYALGTQLKYKLSIPISTQPFENVRFVCIYPKGDILSPVFLTIAIKGTQQRPT
jgi:hypothetical protein